MKKSILITCSFVILFAAAALAQGIIIPDPPRHPHPRPVPFVAPVIKSQTVEVSIHDGAATTTVTQVIHNAWSNVLEGTFIFPLPKGATVNEFYLWIEDKKVKGELLSREEARKIYQDIVRRMKDPALLELADYNLFKASIFPIPAGGDRKIQLKFNQVLEGSGGMLGYTYPLKVRGHSYSKPVESFTMSVNIESGQPIMGIYSPTHKVDVTQKDDRHASVGMEVSNFASDKDFLLYYSYSNKEFGLSFSSYREAGEADGFFMMLIAPRMELERKNVAAKDIVFVLDTSGSMQDDNKIEQAVSALKFGLRSLNKDDRFGLITFSTEIRPFGDILLQASADNVEAAVKSLEGVSATGSTNIYGAMQTALSMIGKDNRPRYVVFLTDGLPTHMETDPAVIVKKTGEWAPEGVRIFTWGVGYDVDTFLLDSISGKNGGASEYVKPREEMELKLGQFFEKITFPVLTNVSLQVKGLTLKDMYPGRLPDLFKGTQITVFGRYAENAKGEVVLKGMSGGKQVSFTFPVDTTKTNGGDFIAHLWATRKVGTFLDQIRLSGENKELKDEVIRLAKKYGLVTPYTSYLVTEPQMDRPADTRAVNVTAQAPLVDKDDEAEMYVSPEAGEVLRKDSAATSGRQAVNYSKKLKELKNEEQAGSGASANIRRLEDKTFMLIDEVWVDSEYQDGMKEIEIVVGSDEYFDLISKEGKMAKWLALGERMIIVYDGVAFRIVPEK